MSEERGVAPQQPGKELISKPKWGNYADSFESNCGCLSFCSVVQEPVLRERASSTLLSNQESTWYHYASLKACGRESNLRPPVPQSDVLNTRRRRCLPFLSCCCLYLFHIIKLTSFRDGSVADLRVHSPDRVFFSLCALSLRGLLVCCFTGFIAVVLKYQAAFHMCNDALLYFPHFVFTKLFTSDTPYASRLAKREVTVFYGAK